MFLVCLVPKILYIFFDMITRLESLDSRQTHIKYYISDSFCNFQILDLIFIFGYHVDRIKRCRFRSQQRFPNFRRNFMDLMCFEERDGSDLLALGEYHFT